LPSFPCKVLRLLAHLEEELPGKVPARYAHTYMTYIHTEKRSFQEKYLQDMHMHTYIHTYMHTYTEKRSFQEKYLQDAYAQQLYTWSSMGIEVSCFHVY
jgi:hypothetical protein